MRCPPALAVGHTCVAIGLSAQPATGATEHSCVGRLEFAVDTQTKRVTLVGVPAIGFCE